MKPADGQDKDAKDGLKLWKKIKAVQKCQRCGAPLDSRGLSLLKDEVLCYECKEREKSLPEYKIAAADLRKTAKESKQKFKKKKA